MERVEVVKVERVFDEFWAVDRATVRYEKPDGAMSEPVTRLSVERGDSVAVILHDVRRDRLIFVRQFRYPALRHGEPYLLEAVAGKIDEGESPSDAALREIDEEVGYRPRDLLPIAHFLGSPGGLSEMLHLFYAEVDEADRPHEGNLLEGEDVTIVELPPTQAFAMLEDGQVHDAKTMIGLMWLRRRLGL